MPTRKHAPRRGRLQSTTTKTGRATGTTPTGRASKAEAPLDVRTGKRTAAQTRKRTPKVSRAKGRAIERAGGSNARTATARIGSGQKAQAKKSKPDITDYAAPPAGPGDEKVIRRRTKKRALTPRTSASTRSGSRGRPRAKKARAHA